jgi:hypothetical protein
MITLARIMGYVVRKLNEYSDRAYVAYLVARDPEHYAKNGRDGKS